MIKLPKRNALNVLLIRVLKMTQSLLTFFIMAKLFGEEELGFYIYSFSIALSLIVLSYFGSEQLSLKLLSKSHLFIGRLIFLKFLFSIFTVTIYIYLIKNNIVLDGDVSSAFVFFMCFYIIFNFELLIFTYFNTQGKLNVLLFSLSISFFITTSLKLFSLFYEQKNILYASISLDAGIPFFIFCSYIYHNEHRLLLSINVRKLMFFIKRNYTQLVSLFIAALLIQINIRVDSYFVANFLGGESLSNYSVAIKFNEVLAILISSIVALYSPTFFKCNSKKELTIVIYKLITKILLLYLLSTVMVFITFEYVNDYFFDKKYAQAENLIFILFLSTFFGGISSIVSLWYIYYGDGVSRAKRVFISLLANIILSIYLIPKLGLIGAALASLAVSFILAIILNSNKPDLRKVFRIVVFNKGLE